MFPDGISYRVLVLPQFDTMTPALLARIETLVEHRRNRHRPVAWQVAEPVRLSEVRRGGKAAGR